jgi:gentisate 1,2-dioxygenase
VYPFSRANDELKQVDSVEYPGMTTLAMSLHKLRPGTRRRPQRHTGSKLYYVFRGHGSSVVEGTTYDWNQGDFLAIPPWSWHEHATGAEAILFEVNDTPAMKALGYYREETK